MLNVNMPSGSGLGILAIGQAFGVNISKGLSQEVTEKFGRSGALLSRPTQAVRDYTQDRQPLLFNQSNVERVNKLVF